MRVSLCLVQADLRVLAGHRPSCRDLPGTFQFLLSRQPSYGEVPKKLYICIYIYSHIYCMFIHVYMHTQDFMVFEAEPTNKRALGLLGLDTGSHEVPLGL